MSTINVDIIQSASASNVTINDDLIVTGTNNIRPYKVYTASLSQNGTSAPTATVHQNTLSGSITWSRISIGHYRATLVGEFSDMDSVVVFVNQAGIIPLAGGDSVYTYAFVEDSDSITLDTLVSSNFQDGMLFKTSFEIRVY